MREFISPPSFSFETNVRGEIGPVMTLDGVTCDAEGSRFIDQKFARDPRFFARSTFASLFRDVGVGKTRLESDMLMYYGSADEASPDSIATIIATWQRGTYGKTNLDQISVPFASHHGTFLTAVAGQFGWFNAKRGLPDAVTDLTATPIDGGAGATLSWTAPDTSGRLPITEYRVQWKLATAADWSAMISTGSSVNSFTVSGLTAGQQIQFRVFSVSPAGKRSILGLSSNVAVMG
jgi:hypothetical protein